MAFVGSTTDLAIAVCKAGGIGSIDVGLIDKIKPTEEIINSMMSEAFLTIFSFKFDE